MVIHITTRFEKNYKKLPQHIKVKAKEREIIFRQNPFDLRLQTHKLRGKEKEHWAFWVDYSYRIKFLFLKEEEILFLDIGTQAVYQ